MVIEEFDFDVALSFAGEDREYVEKVAYWLKKMDIRVFYDKYDSINLWGKDLYVHLNDIYNKKARYTVIFISKHYANKLWTDHERRSAQARAFTEKGEYILPVRFDETEIPGVLSTTGYISLDDIIPKDLAFMIKKKIGPFMRYEFLPNNLDRLYEYMEVTDKDEQKRIYNSTDQFFEALKLMTIFERKVIVELAMNCCPGGLPDNLHINIDLFSRILSIPKEEIISIFSRLDCLNFNFEVDELDDDDHIDPLSKSTEIIKVKFEPLTDDIDYNSTFIINPVIECIHENVCLDCSKKSIERLDFSILSHFTGFPEK